MATNHIGLNIEFKIYNADGTEFNNLVLKRSAYETVVMSLGDKITGDVYYKNNTLAVTMHEYIVYNGVKFILVSPPTIVREGIVSENSELKGMTKYSFTFYHPMYQLGNFPFADIAVSSSQDKYLSQNKTFSWIGNLVDYVAKLNKNLDGTEWVCEIGSTVLNAIKNKLSDVLSFDNQTIADALKTEYETWSVPYIIDTIASTDSRYAQGKRFVVHFGLPSDEIRDTNNDIFVFKFGKGVGLKNNSRTPRNNKIITRIAGYGSENNVPYGYPQIVWTGNQSWNYTINNSSSASNSYPIYDGIVNGQRVRLIKHPFTRNHLMPSVYSDAVNKKVNPLATGYNPDIELKDYYDAVSSQEYTYPNPINPLAPSYEIHEFDDIKPELGQISIVGISAYDQEHANAITLDECTAQIIEYYNESQNHNEKAQLSQILLYLPEASSAGRHSDAESYHYDWSLTSDSYYAYITYKSSILNFSYIVLRAQYAPEPVWDDTMDDDGKYKQSYFKITLPRLSFDLYACAAITQEMSINMRSGACIGCTFPIMVDWDDYKKNFYDADGNFDPVIGEGHPRNGDKYPNSSQGQISVVVQKDNQTFGTLMPNIYQKPSSNDNFVILGISLPLTYITSAESRLDAAMVEYMKENNVHYFDYPLKFDEHFLAKNTNILSQIKPNVIVRFEYVGGVYQLYIKQMSVKWGQSPLPQYDITLTDNIDVVLNPVGKVADDVRRISLEIGGGANLDYEDLFKKLDERYDQRYISKNEDDTAYGRVRLMRGLQVGERFVTGLLGEGAVFRRDDDNTTYLEVDRMYVRMKAYFDTVEIRKYQHSSGNRIASLAGIKCSRVEYIDTNGDVTDDATDAVKFRCYFRADDNGDTVTNDFVVGDLAFCKETNAQVASGVQQHGYWRAVVGKNVELTDEGEGWIDLSATDCLENSGIPIAQDDIIQLGNKTDVTRQGAIIEFVGGEDAPSYQIYQGINTYSLENKNYVSMGYNSSNGHAYLNVYGDFRFGSRNNDGSYILYNSQDGILDVKARISASSTIGSQTLPDYIKENQDSYDDSWIQPALDAIQEQIDGELDTWYYAGVPTLNNAPANTWTTDELKNDHVGDLYYDKNTGYVYRFIYDTSVTPNVYKWIQIHDDAISEALKIASQAQDTADNKRRVFICDDSHHTPTPPYDKGDLWVNVKYPWVTGATYNNEILKCVKSVPRTEQGQQINTFSINDWSLANGYTAALNNFVNNTYSQFVQDIQGQVDQKAETWYQSTDPSQEWSEEEKTEHIGDIWHNTSSSTIAGIESGQDGIWSGTAWVPSSVPQEVYDKIDGKAAIYVTWNAWGNNLHDKDLFIPASNTTKGGVTYKANKVYRWDATNNVWREISYTDDTALNNFLNNTYANDKQDLQSQIDGKAETWRQTSNPASAWTTDDEKAKHVGDLWMDISANGGNNTYIYQNTGTSSSPIYEWVAQVVPDAVFDKIDGKSSIFVSQPSNYKANDLWILATDTTISGVSYKKGEVLTATQDSTTYNQAHWKKKVCYTDDTALTTFINGAYATFVSNIQGQVDQKAETWYQDDDPSSAWTTDALKASHVGDIWFCTINNPDPSPYKKGTTWIWQSHTNQQGVVSYAWEEQTVPDEVFDKIDGKADIFIQRPTTYNINDMWVIENGLDSTYMPTGCKAGDIVFSSVKRTNSYNKADWSKKDRYTDDTYAHGFDFLASNLARLSTTEIDGGLVLSSLIGLRDTNNNIQSGINGIVDTTKKGNGIAAWYGGEQGDKEDQSHYSSITRWAKSLFRFDGSGYLADGNITWDASGTISIRNITTLIGDNNTDVLNELATFNNAFTFQTQQGTGTILSIVPQAPLAFNTPQGNAPFSVVSNTLVTNLNADMLDGLHQSNFTRRWGFSSIDGNYIKRVFAFCRLTASSTSPNSYSSGRFTHLRRNGNVIVARYADIIFQGLYSGAQTYACSITTNIRNKDTNIDSTNTGFRPCRFKYDNVWYAGLEFYGGQVVPQIACFSGISTLDVFYVEYYNQNSSTVLNQEVYDSIDFTGGKTEYARLDIGSGDGAYITIGDIRLQYDATNNALKVVQSDGTTAANFYATGGISALGQSSGGGGGGGATELNDLVDVELSDVQVNQVLKYSNGKWRNMADAGGISISDMWNALGDNTTTQQIASSHLTTALSNYVLKTDLATTTTNGLMSADDKKYLSYITPILKGSANTSATAQYTFFARTPANYSSRWASLTTLVHGLGYSYSGQFTGTYIVELRNYMGTPSMQATVLSPKGTSGTVTFGYYNNTDDGYIYFGVYTSTRHNAICVEPINNQNSYFEPLATPVVLTSQPTGWTTVETRTYADASQFLKLSGGTMTGNVVLGTNYLLGADEAGGAILYFDGERTVIGSNGTSTTLATHIRSITGHATIGTGTYESYTIWDSGNDGADSGLDADLLDGQHGSYFATASNVTTLQGYFTNGVANSAAKLDTARTLWGRSFDGSANVSGAIANANNITPQTTNTYSLGTSSLVWSNVYATSFTGNLSGNVTGNVTGNLTGNADTATALATARTLWGRSFDGSANVTGTITVGAGDIVMNNNRYLYIKNTSGTSLEALRLSSNNDFLIGYGTAGNSKPTYLYGNTINLSYGSSRTLGMVMNTSGYVGIGTSSPSERLSVSGNEYISGNIENGGYLFSGDSIFSKGNALLLNTGTNKLGLMIEGFYATTYGGRTTFGMHAASNNWANSWSTRSGTDDYMLQLILETNNTVAKKYVKVIDGICIGDGIITWDSANNSFKIQNLSGGAANLYALGGISALGISSNSGGKVSGNLIPNVDGSYELGSSSYGWEYLYLSDSSYTGRIFVDSDGLNLYSEDGIYIDAGQGNVARFVTDVSIDSGISVSDASYIGGKLSIAGTNSNSDKLYVNGSMRSSGISYASSHNNTSDARQKNIIEYNPQIDLPTLASAPIVRFTWNEGDDHLTHLGTIAQYWDTTDMRDVVTHNDLLSMDYSAAALVGVITLARTAMSHEDEIRVLKERIEELENEVEQLKEA